MEITKDNFETYQKQIIADIETSEFVSLDLEMTGINPNCHHILDYPEGRYLKYKSAAERFRIIQLGICTWHKESMQEDSFVARPYNIYVFPDEDSPFINCETQAIIFNREHGMDFNKWIYKGVQYCNAKQHKQMLENRMEGRLNSYDPTDKTKFRSIVISKPEDIAKYDELCKMFSEFLYSENNTWIYEKYPRFIITHLLNNMQEKIRKRIWLSYETIDNKSVLMMRKVNEQERKVLEENEYKERLVQIEKKVGVKKIFDAMTNKKTIVGHNCHLDLLFTVSHFGESLPNNLKEWKTLIRRYFKEVYDTKLMYEKFTEQTKLKSEVEGSHLNNVYTTLRNLYKDRVKIKVSEGFVDYFQSAGIFHQADYDAFVTGCSFLYLAEQLRGDVNLFSNKINLMRSIYSCIDFNADETLAIPNSIPYCLRATNKTSDINLSLLISDSLFQQIKKIYNLETNNALLIIVQFENSEMMRQFEVELGNFKDTFEFYYLPKFKEIIKQEEEKKHSDRRNMI